MTNNTTSYVNTQTLKELHNNPAARTYLAVIDSASASLVTAIDMIDNGIVPTNMMYSGINPANIIELFDDGVARYKAIRLYKRVVDAAIAKLLALGCINHIGDIYNKVSSGFSYEGQADAFLMAYATIK